MASTDIGTLRRAIQDECASNTSCNLIRMALDILESGNVRPSADDASMYAALNAAKDAVEACLALFIQHDRKATRTVAELIEQIENRPARDVVSALGDR